jgi:hypothetical protein
MKKPSVTSGNIVIGPQPTVPQTVTTTAEWFRCPRCDRMGVRAQGVVAPICEACRKAWGGK